MQALKAHREEDDRLQDTKAGGNGTERKPRFVGVAVFVESSDHQSRRGLFMGKEAETGDEACSGM